MEDSNKLTLAEILHIIGLFILGILTYLGAHYIFEGNFILAGGTTLILVILIWLSIHLIGKLKKTDEYRHDARQYEILCLVFWGILSIGASYLMIHGQNVEVYLKKEIQVEKEKEINELMQIIKSYKEFVDDRAVNYNSELENNLRQNNSSINNATIQTKDFRQRITLGLSSKENEIFTFVSNGEVVIKLWDRFDIPQLLNVIPDKKTELLKFLTNLSVSHPFTVKTPFSYVAKNTKEFDLSKPASLFTKTNILLAIISILIINLLVLVPVLTEGRKSGKIVKMKVDNTF